ncbi:hypothetical protein BASA81_010174 [Batrachochytrium salamandrivorans]|nr:hypothetical protein BASA81_010174 [Batrachochytrium salamandrivorans]
MNPNNDEGAVRMGLFALVARTATAGAQKAAVAPAPIVAPAPTVIATPSAVASEIQAVREEIVKMKKDPSATKPMISLKGDELERLRFQFSEEQGGFNPAERKSYETKLAKLKRKQEAEELEKKRAAENAAKKAAKESAAGPAEVVPPPQVFSGKKKDVSGSVLSSYHPANVEAVWDAWWTQSGFFTPDSSKEHHGETFTMVIPPPNVTGSLHIGHALTCSIEDSVTRWHRMLGHRTLWLPGTDHAGIATQTVVEKQLVKEWEKDKSKPKTKQEMGREKFLDRVWEWKNDRGGTILGQIRRLGASVDHTRTVFTMDDQNNVAVIEAFNRLHAQGKIYRATRLVHWSYALKTAISSIEVDDDVITSPDNQWRKVPGHSKQEKYKFGVFHHFAYKVHSEDWREVKITPAHDENDFQAAKRLGVPKDQFVSIFDDNGAVSTLAAGNAAEVAGMMRYDARVWILKDLEQRGLFKEETSNFGQILPICSRSGDVIEPRLVPQWWVDCQDMAARACEAVEQKQLELIPSYHENVWFQWLRNIQPWCVSRQLWWGHRIPAWKLENGGEDEQWFVGRNVNEARAKAQVALGLDSIDQVPELVQDEDVLDTWFSSGLFPFASFGWPNQDSNDLKAFFPGQLLETGHDILFFWVARMVMMSLGLTDQLPFKQVYLHAMVRDKDGRKMSKSLGNVIDPVDVMEGRTIEYLVDRLREGNLSSNEVVVAEAGLRKQFPTGLPECGTDALRFGLLAYTAQGRDVNLDVNKVHAYRTFCNKIWNIYRFVEGLAAKVTKFTYLESNVQAKSTRDAWILHRLALCAKDCNESFTKFAFSGVTTALYDFWYYDLADVYIEAVKPLFRDETKPQEQIECLHTLYFCLDVMLRLTHPVMPFISEELWQFLPIPKPTETICLAPYPVFIASLDRFVNDSAMDAMRLVLDTTKTFRHLMVQNGNAPTRTAEITIVLDDLQAFSPEQLGDLQTLCRVEKLPIAIGSNGAGETAEALVEVIRAGIKLMVTGLPKVDMQLEKQKLEKRRNELEKFYGDLKTRIANPSYAARAKPSQIENDNVKLAEFEAEIATVVEQLSRM